MTDVILKKSSIFLNIRRTETIKTLQRQSRASRTRAINGKVQLKNFTDLVSCFNVCGKGELHSFHPK